MSEATAAEPVAKPNVSTETTRSIDISSIKDAAEAKALLTQLNKAYKGLKAKYAKLEAVHAKATADHQKAIEQHQADYDDLLDAANTYEGLVRDYSRKDAFDQAAKAAGLKPERFEHALKQFDVDFGDVDKDGNWTGEVDVDGVTEILQGFKEKPEWSDWYASDEADEPAPSKGKGNGTVLNEYDRGKPSRPTVDRREPMAGGRNQGGTDFGIERARQIVSELQGTSAQRLRASKQYTPEQIAAAYDAIESDG